MASKNLSSGEPSKMYSGSYSFSEEAVSIDQNVFAQDVIQGMPEKTRPSGRKSPCGSGQVISKPEVLRCRLVGIVVLHSGIVIYIGC